MALLTISLLALATVVPWTRAFTNGSLVPEYFCHPDADGMPQSLGELLPFLVKDQGDPIAFNNNSASNLMMPPMTNSTPGNAAYIIASFHNTLNKITPIEQGIMVTTLSGGPLIAGQPNVLNISTGDPNVPLDGAMLYAKTPDLARVGSFVDPSGTFKDFPGCGLNGQGQPAGVIHQMIISNCAFYTGLSFNVPKCNVGPITLAGLDVTDNGFGVWNVTMEVQGAVANASDCGQAGWHPW